MKEEETNIAKERDEWKRKAVNLICRAHRDSGHYLHQHGIEKAFEDADNVIATAFSERDELKAAFMADHSATCIHHNDEERKGSGCPVCLNRKLTEANAQRHIER